MVAGPERLRGWEAWHGVAGAPGHARYIPLAVLRAPESPFYRLFHLFSLRPRGQHGLKTALQAILGSSGSFSREDLVFRAGLAQVQLARLRLAEPDNVFGDFPEEPVFWAWAILTPIYQRLRRARRLLSLRTGQGERMDRIPCSGIQEPQGLTDFGRRANF